MIVSFAYTQPPSLGHTLNLSLQRTLIFTNLDFRNSTHWLSNISGSFIFPCPLQFFYPISTSDKLLFKSTSITSQTFSSDPDYVVPFITITVTWMYFSPLSLSFSTLPSKAPTQAKPSFRAHVHESSRPQLEGKHKCTHCFHLKITITSLLCFLRTACLSYSTP